MKRPRVLILDDDPARHEAFSRMLPGARISRAYTASQAVRKLSLSGPFDIAFLDHDLNQSANLVGIKDPGNGLQVAQFIADKPHLAPHHVWIHSWNDQGRQKMRQVLRAAGIPVTLQKFRHTSRLVPPCHT